MNRRGIADTLVALAVILVIFLIFFLVLVPLFQEKAKAAGAKSQCEWSVLLAGLGKAGTIGFAEGIPEGCKAKRVTITMDDIRSKLTYARNRLKIIQDPKHTEYDATSAYFRKQPMSDRLLYEFAIEKIVADEIVECWDKVWKGKVPLFDEWWKLYNVCTNPATGKTESCGTLEAIAKGAWQVITGAQNVAPTNCILCAHISFDPAVQAYFANSPRTRTMMEWLSNNPVPRTGKDYASYLAEGQTIGGFAKMSLNYDFDITDPGIAIVFERRNAHQLFQQASSLGSWVGLADTMVDESYLHVLPYKQEAIVAPAGECHFILD